MNTIRLNVLGEAKAASSGVSIKNQDKSVEIVENGVTEVTADSGYTGLGKVTINANVQGGGSSSGGEDFLYIKMPKENSDTATAGLRLTLYSFSCAVSIDTYSMTGGAIPAVVLPTAYQEFTELKDVPPHAVMIAQNIKVMDMQSQTETTIKELLETAINATGKTVEYITKEQFYNPTI